MKQTHLLPFLPSKSFLAASLLLAMSLCCSVAQAQSTNAIPPGQGLGVGQDGPGAPNYVPNEILVKFKPGAKDNEIADLVRRAAVTHAKHVLTPAMHASGDIGITRLSTAVHVPQALEALRNHPAIELAQPNWLYTHQAAPNDQYYVNGSLWGLDGSTYGSQAAAAWAAGNTGSKDVYVGIIDEGVQYNHPDLMANMWVNTAEKDGTAGVDDDDNGYIDDIYGWNAINDNGTIYDPRWDDHGTHVAGTIGAVGNNGVGVVGMNWNVKLIVGKFLGPRSGTTADAIQAIDYMTNLKKNKGVNIVALNNSWGGGAFDGALLDAIKRAAAQNILFVAAAGNNGVNTAATPSFPACYDDPSIVSVAAIDRYGNLPSFSNYGATTVDLGAPGVAIYSTLPGGKYGAYDGTSMATPHVTGAAALYAAANPTAEMLDIKSAILSSATLTPTPSLKGKTVTGGRLNVSGFTAASATPPAAPSALSATVDERTVNSIVLSWTDNSDNETFFVIERATSLGGTRTSVATVPSNTKAYVDAGLQPGTYVYWVASHNTAGNSWSDPALETTVTFPETPAAASYIKTDTTTKGNWCYVYGASGSGHLPYAELDPPLPYEYNYPLGVIIDWSDVLPWDWTATTMSSTDPRALWKDYSMTGRWLGCYYFYPSLTLDLDTGNTPYQVAFYVVQGDSYNRTETIEILDFYRQTSIGVDPQVVKDFTGGKYFVYNIQGRVLVRFTCSVESKDAVLSGIFFDALEDSPPAVSIKSPTEGASVSGTTVTISASASDDNAVAKVDFYVDGNLIGTDYTATDGFSVSWDSTKAAEGNHVLTAEATDTAGNTAPSEEEVTVVVDNIPDTAVLVHCGDLDGTPTVSTRNWTATVAVTIHNAEHDPVEGATVTGTWSGGFSGTVSAPTVRRDDGSITAVFKTGSMKLTKTSVTFTILSVTGPNMSYASSNNHDPEGDSKGTSITVRK